MRAADPAAPVGLFDSGLGGLTVASAIRRALPAERLLYLGDTARVPYGTRSPQTVQRYARRAARFLAARGIKALVVACNTVSAVALDMLRVELDVPVLGVIEPGAHAALRASPGGRIALLATAGTVASGAYERAIAALDPRAEVLARPAALLVALAEEGWTEGEIAVGAARRYLAPLIERGADSVLLGCTHFPLLRGAVRDAARQLAGRRLPVVDGAAATAEALRAVLQRADLLATEPRSDTAPLELLVTDRPQHFSQVAGRFLGAPLAENAVQWVDL